MQREHSIRRIRIIPDIFLSARAVDEAEFSGIVKWCWDCAGGRAQSARVSGSDGATAQAVCRPCVFLVTPMHAHISARAVDEADFSTEKWCWDCAGGRAESARVSGSDDATAQAVCRPWVCSCLCDVCFGGVSWIVVGVGRGRLLSDVE